MAILKNGLLGGITGKLGNTVCYMLNGKQVVRMIVRSTKQPTQSQLDNRAEMRMVNEFLKPLKDLIKIGYGPEAKARNLSAYNLAVSYTKKYALMGERPDRQIDYTRIKLSSGGIEGLRMPEAMMVDGVLRISWQTGFYPYPCSSPRDQVMVLAYFPAHSEAGPIACFKNCGVDRSAGEYLLSLPQELSGRRMEIYAFAGSSNGKAMSDSQYLGQLVR